MRIRLTESELKNIVRSAVIRTINESNNDSMLLNLICHKIEDSSIPLTDDGIYEVTLDEAKGEIAIIEFDINDGRYLKRDGGSIDRDLPDEPDSVIGDYDIEVVGITIYDGDGNEIYELEDDGRVSNFIKENLILNNENIPYIEDEF